MTNAMTKQKNAFKAGLFIIISIILIVAILIAIKGFGSLFEPMASRQASFTLEDNIGGLRVGDDVRVGGFRVGTVRSINVADAGASADHQPHIVIHYSIPKKFIIHDDAKLVVETTVTGTSVLNFVSLGKGAELKPDQTLAGQPGTLQTILGSLSSAAPQVDGLLKDVRSTIVPHIDQTVTKFGAAADSFHKTGQDTSKLIADLRQQIDPTVKRYDRVADSATRMFDNAGDLFGDIKTDFRSTVAHLNEVSGDMAKRLPGLLDQVDHLVDHLNHTVDGINTSLSDIQAVFTNAREFTGSARDLLMLNRTRISGMIDSLKKTSDNLKFASEEIRRSPWRLLYKPKENEMANMNVFDSARQFAQGANSLADTAGALRDAMSLPHPDQKQIQKLMQQLDLSFSHFQSVEKKLWQSVKE
jgi:ABC-type transporter Mla subunit MlaD